MTDQRRGSDELEAVRRRAEERAIHIPDDLSGLSPEGARRLLHELRVHQIELDLQNDELRRIQAELEASRTRYFDLYHLAPVGYLTLNAAGSILESNLTAATLLGVPTSALVTQPFHRFILPEDQDIYYRHRRKLASRESKVCELRMLRAGADPFWAHIEESTGRDGDDTPVSRVVVSDITDRRYAEQALRESEERHRALFERSRDALMTLAPPTWRFTAGNATAVALFGASSLADFTSRTPWQLSPEHQPDGVLSATRGAEAIEAAMRDGSCAFEWTFRRLTGEEFPASVLFTRLEIGGRASLQGTVRDVTEVRRLQASVAQSDRLASIGMLAAGVAHEINNPLAYVLYNVEDLARSLARLAGQARSGAPDLAAALEDLASRALETTEGVQRIRKIAQGLGTFSRRERAEPTVVDVNATIERVVAMAENEIKFRARLSRELGLVPPVRAPEGKLAQVFLNLLINAAQAIPEGHAGQQRITIRTRSDRGVVVVEVADSGTGIPREQLDRIFEPFFTTKTAGAGSGLGLAICKNIVDELGGDIRVESQVGEGTCFTVRLPLPLAAPEPRTSPVPPAAPGAVARGRILVVDDEEGIRRAMKRLLAAAHEVVTAASGEEAQRILEDDRNFDVVVCDLMMAEMSGMELHAWLAQKHPELAARLVFVTGGTFTPEATEYVARTGVRRIEKPFHASDVERLVADMVAMAKPDQ